MLTPQLASMCIYRKVPKFSDVGQFSCNPSRIQNKGSTLRVFPGPSNRCIAKSKEYFQRIIPKGIINCEVYVFLSLFIKFSAMGLHQDIRYDIFSYPFRYYIFSLHFDNTAYVDCLSAEVTSCRILSIIVYLHTETFPIH